MLAPSSSRTAAIIRSAAGAMHLPSILTATVVVGILTAGVLASVFGVLPFAQDQGAHQALSAARTAEAVSLTKDGDYADSATLAERSYLGLHDGLEIGTSAEGRCFLAVAKSGSGTAFYSTHRSSDVHVLTPSTSVGCLTPRAVQSIIDAQGGWDPELFEPTGTGAGTAEDPGTGVLTEGDPGAAGSPVALESMTIVDRDVTMEVANTSGDSVDTGYTVKATCENITTGAVTVEMITGHIGVGPNTVTGVRISACSTGNVPIGVAAHSARDFGLAQGGTPVRNAAAWKNGRVYYQAMPIVRGAFTAGKNCIDNTGQAVTDGNPVTLSACAAGDAQRWQWNGYGPITQAGLEGKCLTLPVGASALVLSTCDSSDTQHFAMVRGTDGAIHISHPATGKCLDTRNGTAPSGSALGVTGCSNPTPKPWTLPEGADLMVAGSIPNDPVPPASTGFTGAPAQPGNVAVVKYVGSGVHLKWSTSTGATAYRLDATGTKTTTNADGSTTVENIAVSTTILGGDTSTGSIKVPSGTEGQVTVTALNGDEASTPSEPVAISVPKSSVIL